MLKEKHREANRDQEKVLAMPKREQLEKQKERRLRHQGKREVGQNKQEEGR